VHAKLWIVDNTVAFVGSVNLTDNSLGFKAGALEVMVRIEDPRTVAALRDSFDALWKYTPFRQHLHGEHLRIEKKQKAVVPIDSGILSTKIRSGLALHWNIPGQSATLLDSIVNEIEKARSNVVLCARSFVDLHKVPRLLGALHAALQRGVEITAVVAQDAFTEAQYPDPPTRELLSAGLAIRGWPGLHAKGVLVDNKTVISLSANFNPSLDMDNPNANIECGITCSASDSPFSEFRNYLLDLREHAPYQLTPTT
jgi:phosphatidylserine/phosphatidylglycerophosphate/cardiolipin synthase-like enzyme